LIIPINTEENDVIPQQFNDTAKDIKMLIKRPQVFLKSH